MSKSSCLNQRTLIFWGVCQFWAVLSHSETDRLTNLLLEAPTELENLSWRRYWKVPVVQFIFSYFISLYPYLLLYFVEFCLWFYSVFCENGPVLVIGSTAFFSISFFASVQFIMYFRLNFDLMANLEKDGSKSPCELDTIQLSQPQVRVFGCTDWFNN